MSFVHLHVHSDFSLLDSTVKVPDLVERVSELGQSVVALTDHGFLGGAIKFQKTCLEAGIKPIVGMEAYVATQESHLEPAEHPGDNYHLTLLAQNEAGWKNLMTLCSLGYLEGLHWKPRIDKELLARHAEGIIVLSGCVSGELPQLIAHGRRREARDLTEWYLDTFGERFFVEVMYHGSTGGEDNVRIEGPNGDLLVTQSEMNERLRGLAAGYGVPLVATNDVHYLSPDDGHPHDLLLCIKSGKTVMDEDRLRFPGAEHEAWEFFLKSEEEMMEMVDADWWKEACGNTKLVADAVRPGVIGVGQTTVLPRFEITPELEVATRVWEETGEIIM